MQELIDKYFNLLWDYITYDLDVMSNIWMYIPLLIPAFLYIGFMSVKWAFLLMPIMIPLGICLNFIKDVTKNIFK